MARQQITPAQQTSAATWWEEIGRTTLGGTADTITVSGLTTKKYLWLICTMIPSGAIAGRLTFNNDTANNYANRNSTDGAADATQLTNPVIHMDVTANAAIKLSNMWVLNIAAQEKFMYGVVTEPGTAGAGNAPSRRELSAKWANTSNAISRIDITNNAAGNYAAGSELIVLGHD